jgi:hypothetical protein
VPALIYYFHQKNSQINNRISTSEIGVVASFASSGAVVVEVEEASTGVVTTCSDNWLLFSICLPLNTILTAKIEMERISGSDRIGSGKAIFIDNCTIYLQISSMGRYGRQGLFTSFLIGKFNRNFSNF